MTHTNCSIVFATRRQCAPQPNTWFHRPTQLSIPSCISIGTAVFAQLTTHSPYILEWVSPSPLKIALSRGVRSGPYLIQNFLWMSTDGQGTKCRRKIDENFNRLSRVHERCRRQTTDRRQQIANVNVNVANSIILQMINKC